MPHQATYVADVKSLDEVRVDDFLVWWRYGDHVEGGVQAVFSRVIQNLVTSRRVLFIKNSIAFASDNVRCECVQSKTI